MSRGLVLYVEGGFEVKQFSSSEEILEELNEIVDGPIQMLPFISDYYNTEKKRSERLLGYVNEEGLLRQLEINPFSGFLQLLGTSSSIPWYFGNVVLFLDGNNGREKSIPPYIVSLAELVIDCEDEDDFYCSFEEEQKTKTAKMHLVKRKEQ